MAKVISTKLEQPVTDGDQIRELLGPEGANYALWPIEGLSPRLQNEYALTSEEKERLLNHFAASTAPLIAQGGYITADIVVLWRETPNLDSLLEAFAREHHHADDEVRFCIHGQGVFHLKGKDGATHSVWVEPGDLLVVPAGMRHWFALAPDRQIKCIRLFSTPAGWQAIY